MLVTWVDILFVTLGGIITILMLRRRWRVPSPEASPHRATLLELILTALALLVAAIGPNILVVALTPGMPEMPLLTKWALIPSLVLLVLVWVNAL
jgi:type VI protein secretion system component VasK